MKKRDHSYVGTAASMKQDQYLYVQLAFYKRSSEYTSSRYTYYTEYTLYSLCILVQATYDKHEDPNGPVGHNYSLITTDDC